MELATEEIITDNTVSPVFQRAINARGWVDVRAYEIQQELERVSRIRGLYRVMVGVYTTRVNLIEADDFFVFHGH